MPRVGDKPLLFFVAFGDRLDDFPGQNEDHKKYYDQPGKCHSGARIQEIVKEIQSSPAVKKNHAGAILLRAENITVLSDKALRFISV